MSLYTYTGGWVRGYWTFTTNDPFPSPLPGTPA